MVDFSDKVKESEDEIRYFLKMKMYNNKDVLKKIMKENRLLKDCSIRLKKSKKIYF